MHPVDTYTQLHNFHKSGNLQIRSDFKVFFHLESIALTR